MTLTHSQIDAMTPDQLNEAVAVHVMGWGLGVTDDGTPCYINEAVDDFECVTHEFLPDTDANDALRVCENMAQKGFTVCVEKTGNGNWSFNLHMVYSDKIVCPGYSSGRFGLCVCRAALHAVAEMEGSDG